VETSEENVLGVVCLPASGVKGPVSAVGKNAKRRPAEKSGGATWMKKYQEEL